MDRKVQIGEKYFYSANVLLKECGKREIIILLCERPIFRRTASVFLFIRLNEVDNEVECEIKRLL